MTTLAIKHHPSSFGLSSNHDASCNSRSSSRNSTSMQYYHHNNNDHCWIKHQQQTAVTGCPTVKTLRTLSRLRRKNRRKLLRIIEMEQDQKIVKQQLGRTPLSNLENTKVVADGKEVVVDDDDNHAVFKHTAKETTFSSGRMVLVEVKAPTSNIIDPSATTRRAPRLIMKRMESPSL